MSEIEVLPYRDFYLIMPSKRLFNPVNKPTIQKTVMNYKMWNPLSEKANDLHEANVINLKKCMKKKTHLQKKML